MKWQALALVFLALPTLAQSLSGGGVRDGWAFVDEVVRPFMDPRTKFVEQRAIPCGGANLVELIRSCVYDPQGSGGFLLKTGFRPGFPSGSYRGEAFVPGPGDRPFLLVSFPDETSAKRFLHEELPALYKWLKPYASLAPLRNWTLRVLVSEGDWTDPSAWTCGFPPGVGSRWWSGFWNSFWEWWNALTKTLSWKVEVWRYPKPQTLDPKDNAPTFQDGIFLVAVRSSDTEQLADGAIKTGGGVKAALLAFGGTKERNYAWRGFFGEPFTRNISSSLERALRQGAKRVCE